MPKVFVVRDRHRILYCCRIEGIASMPSTNLEQRVRALEQEVAQLRSRLEAQPNSDQPWWQKVWGAFRGDPAFLEAMELGRKWRESGRPKRRKKAKRKHADS
jgi:hypothetical protein